VVDCGVVGDSWVWPDRFESTPLDAAVPLHKRMRSVRMTILIALTLLIAGKNLSIAVACPTDLDPLEILKLRKTDTCVQKTVTILKQPQYPRSLVCASKPFELYVSFS
jgi:hypothetical protein